MRNSLIFIFIYLFVTLLSSCKDEEETHLSLSVHEVTFAAEGGTEEIELVTNTEWYISSATEWISFVPTTGAGSSTFTVTTASNPGDTDRNASFLVFAGRNVDTVYVSQQGTYLTLGQTELMFDREGTPQEVALFTNYEWKINIHENAEWCEVDPLEGTGDAVLLLTSTPYEERVPRRDATIEISCNGHSFFITIHQEIENIAPTAPELVSPEDSSIENGIYPFFQWNESIDEDGDPIYYHVLISKNRYAALSDWEDISGRITETEYAVSRKRLDENTLYYWRVLAADDFWGETYSEIRQFRTGTNIVYDDHTVFTIRRATVPYEKTPKLVILGDGFIRDDFGKGNIYDMMSDLAIESFFSLEPLNSYKEYFDVYKIVTYSQESGATVTYDFTDYDIQAQTKNTAFSSNFVGANKTDIDCDTDKVFAYVKDKLGFDEEELDNTTILLIINLDVYAGTTAVSPTGRSISMCPIGRDTFYEVVYHEAAGHGFGRLVDEYIDFPTLTLPDKRREAVEDFRGDDIWSFAANISFTNNRSQTHWQHFMNHADYKNQVGFYEGAFLYGKGIWAAEKYSCMADNIPYFNAPSREAIVRRLMQITGQEFDWDTFYEKDIQKTYPATITVKPTIASKNYPRPYYYPDYFYLCVKE
ncbi:MAG: M64 family metallo-endopeptidase [Tannerellaceae bacterium]|nr:M64 family metallo-endopeptidase [Tannerellaceae bacterium]